MTTAHRPTWKAAVGLSSEASWNTGGAPASAKSILDTAAHTKLKVRTGPQLIDSDKSDILRASLRKLEEAEAKLHSLSHVGLREVYPEIEEEGRRRLLKQTAEVNDERLRIKYNDADDDGGVEEDGWSDLDENPASNTNRQTGNYSDQSDDLDASDTESEDDDSDDEDEEAALQAELAKIRAEREASKTKAEAEAAAEEEAKMEEAALVGNPLLSTSGGDVLSGRVKRRWNDDVVFRNQAKGEPDQSKKRFINDTIRNDFHKRFLNKFIL